MATAKTTRGMGDVRLVYFAASLQIAIQSQGIKRETEKN